MGSSRSAPSTKIAPSTYYELKGRQADPTRAPPRRLPAKEEIRRVWDENFSVYGADKVWKQLKREAIPAARCTVERLMRKLGCARCGPRACVQGLRPLPMRGRRGPRIWWSASSSASRPNALWVADLSYVATWRGFGGVAFVIDVYARRIVGWRVSNSLRTDLALDALEQALHARADTDDRGMIHDSDRGIAIPVDLLHRAACRGRRTTVGGQHWRLLRQRARRVDHRAVQDRGHSPLRAVARPRGGRVRDFGMGRLVQQPTPAWADRRCTASGVRDGVHRFRHGEEGGVDGRTRIEQWYHRDTTYEAVPLWR